MKTSKLRDLLRVEGTDRYEILCYLLFPAGTIGTALNACKSKFGGSQFHVSNLDSDGWATEVVLVELAFGDPSLVPSLALQVIHGAMEVTACQGALCMLDGAFYSYEDIFSADVADQTYAFCVEPDSGVVCLSAAVRTSDAWRSIVEAQRPIARRESRPG